MKFTDRDGDKLSCSASDDHDGSSILVAEAAHDQDTAITVRLTPAQSKRLRKALKKNEREAL